ncbi:uncharacterized protein SCHCODRAFT_02574186 [Schizophyllum commune H4-8]|nr:uncharacterized protein SCHCODRAFT_02574186 [Schizophyllum commune H4-8]KAI5893087.1 hypothetical protein SCHCODRAFT_02574186 [Schizophyllum commune H4-8]
MIECFEHVEHTVDLCRNCDYVFTIDLNLPPLPRHDHPLRAGVVASEAETRSIKEIMVETNGLLQDVNEELEYLRSVVTSLEDVQMYLETMLDVQRAHIAPIRRLPNEVLSEIFMWACLGEEVGGWRCMPVDISQVCKSWRDTIHNLPTLWSQLEYRLYGYTTAKEKRILDLCLRNSKGLPLRHPIKFSHCSGGIATFEIVRRYSAQLTSLTMSIFQPTLGDSLCGTLGDRPLTHLRFLEGEVSHLLMGDVHRVFERRAPALRCVKLTNTLVHTLQLPNLPWVQLDELHLECTWEYALTVLARCTNLPTLTLNVILPSARPNPTAITPHTTMRGLSALKICFAGVEDTRMLDFLTVPGLTSLELSWPEKSHDAAEYRGCHVSRLVGRSACCLNELKLFGVPASERSFVFTSYPGLRSLILYVREDVPVTDDDFVSLSVTASSGSPAMLIDLEELDIGGPGRFRGEVVMDMIKARRAAEKPLKRARIDIKRADLDYFGTVKTADAIEKMGPGIEVWGKVEYAWRW